MDMRRPGPESLSSGEGHHTTQHASEAGPSTETSTIVDAISPPPEGSLASTVPQLPSSPLPSVPSQTHLQLQHDPTPPRHSPTAATPQPPDTNNISTLTAPTPSPPIMHASASVVGPPIPLEPRTSTTLTELNRTGETLRPFDQTQYWEDATDLQALAARMVRLENMTAQRNESMEGHDRARSVTAAHERMMVSLQRDRTLPGIASGSGTAVGNAYQLMIGRQGAGGSFPAVHIMGTSGLETPVLPSRSPQRAGVGLADDDDGVTLRGRRVMMAEQASSGSSRQTNSHQIPASGDRIQMVLNSDATVASLQSRQLPPPSFAVTDSESSPLLQYPSRDLPSSPSATPPTVVRVSTPTTIESSHRADSSSPRPPHLPVQPFTIIEHSSSPASPLVYPPSLPNIRHVFDPTSATAPIPAVPELNNPTAPILLSREVVHLRIRQPSEYHYPLDQPHPLRRRLDDSGRSVAVARYPSPPLPFTPRAAQEYILDPTVAQVAASRLQPRSSASIRDIELPTFRGIYPSLYPASQEATGFVPPGITDSALQTPRPFSASPIRWTRGHRREDANGDEIVSDDEETAAEERQRERRSRSRLTSQSTTDLPLEASGLIPPIATADGENQGTLLPGDEGNDQEKHGIEHSGDMVASGSRTGSAGSSRPGSPGSSQSFDLNSTGDGRRVSPIPPYPLPIPPSEMVWKPSPAARQWSTRFTPIPPLHGSVARARAAAQAKGSRRAHRRYADPVGR